MNSSIVASHCHHLPPSLVLEEEEEGLLRSQKDEVVVELIHQELEKVEEDLPHQLNEDPPLDLSLLRPSRKV